MAFPGTYNISYYKGDTLEFLIYPKDTAGGQYSLNGYDTVKFTISNFRGETSSTGESKITINALATNEGQYIKCVIRPIDGDGDGTPENPGMVGGKTYVYDVEITKKTSPYYQVHTLLSGNVSVTEQVSLPSDEAITPVTAPGAPSNVQVSALTVTDTTALMTWTSPTGTYDKYNIYKLTNPGFGSTVADAVLVETINAGTTSYTYTGLIPATNYILGLSAVNTAVDPDLEGEKAAYNSLVTTDATAPTAPNEPTDVLVDPLAVTDTEITMTWTEPATGQPYNNYNIYYIENPQGVPTMQDAIFVESIASGVTTYTYTGLTPDTNYIVGLTAVNTATEPDLESTAALHPSVINTDIAPPNAPTDIIIDTPNITDTSIPISWTAPATGNPPVAYIVSYIENPTLPLDFASAVPSDPIPANLTSYTISGLTPTTGYGIGVVAVGSEGGVSEPLVHMGVVLTTGS